MVEISVSELVRTFGGPPREILTEIQWLKLAGEQAACMAGTLQREVHAS